MGDYSGVSVSGFQLLAGGEPASSTAYYLLLDELWEPQIIRAGYLYVLVTSTSNANKKYVVDSSPLLFNGKLSRFPSLNLSTTERWGIAVVWNFVGVPWYVGSYVN